jgi:hypothetical protein
VQEFRRLRRKARARSATRFPCACPPRLSQKLAEQQLEGCVQIMGVRQPFHKLGGGVAQARLLYAVEGLHQAEPFLRRRRTMFADMLDSTSDTRSSRFA